MKAPSKNSWFPKNGQRLNTTKESNKRYKASCNPKRTRRHFIICQSITTDKPKFLSTWFHILPLDDWIDNIQTQRNGLRHNIQKSHPSDQKSMQKLTQPRQRVHGSSRRGKSSKQP
jgi:hypothetical protein